MAEIRVAETERDLDEVRALLAEYVEHMAANLPHLDRDAFAEEIRCLGDVYRVVLLATLDGGPAGCVMLRDGASEGSCEVRRLYVRPSSRRRGVARELVTRLIAEARARGCRRMELVAVASYEGAVELYESLGFCLVEPFRDSTTPLTLLRFMGRDL